MYLALADNSMYLAQPQPDLLEYMIAIPTEEGGVVWVREDQLDNVPDYMLYQILQQQPHMAGIGDWFGRIKERRAERKEVKADKKAAKQEFKLQKQAGRTEQFKAITGGIGKIFGGGQDQEQQRGPEDLFPQITGQASIGVSQWWQNPAVIGLGTLIVIGGIVYLARRNNN